MTIIGVIIAGVILSTSMITLVDYQNALARIRFQQQHVAVGNLLASEGVELARGVRDVNFAPGNRSNASITWDRGLNNGVYAQDYTLDLTNGFTLSTGCNETNLNDSCRLWQDPTTGLFSHTPGLSEELRIYRFIEVSDTIPPDSTKKKVVSTVILEGRGDVRSQYKAATILYNTDL